MEITKKYLASKYGCSVDVARMITARAEFAPYRSGANSHYYLKDEPAMFALFKQCLKKQMDKRYKHLLSY